MYKRRSKSKTSVPQVSDTSSNYKENKSLHNVQHENGNEEPSSPVMFEEETSKKEVKNSQKVKSAKRLSYLEEITRFSGMIIHKKDTPNQLETDQCLFIQKVNTFLTKNDANLKRNVSILMDDLKGYCQKLHCFKNSLSPTATVEGCDVTRGNYQDSLMRLFLQVDALYQPISYFLVDKMAELTASEDQSSEGISWVRLIVQALKYLDNPSSDCKLGEKLLDIMLVSSDCQVQIEIINSLPAIISDEEHSSCALELSKLVTNEKLLGVSLEALSQLTFDADIQIDVQETLIKSLRRIPCDFYPVIVKFLLSTCTADHVDEVLNGLRTDLILKDVDASIQIIIFRAIQDCLLAVRFLSTSWLKNISNIKNSEAYRPIDFIVCIIIHSISTDEAKRRAIVSLMRNKIRDKIIKRKLLIETFGSFTQVILQYFQPLMRIGSMLLKSPDVLVVDIAGVIYSGLFEYVEDYYCKLIVNELLVCIGSTGSSSGLSLSAFRILNKIALKHPNKIKRLSQLLIVLLNKLNELSLQEARQLMDMLCSIAYSAESEDNLFSSDCEVLKDELNMLVQKQFSSLQNSVVGCGVIGIIMLIKHIATVPENSSYSNEPIDGSVEEVTLTASAKKALPLFEMLLSHRSRNSGGFNSNVVGCQDSADILRLALNQLSFMITNCSNFDQTLNHYMASFVRNKLKEMYLVTYSSNTSFSDLDPDLPMKVLFCLNEGLKSNDAVNLGPLALSELGNMKKHMSSGIWPLTCLNPTLRLLGALERHDITEMDVLLGCGLVLPDTNIFNPSNFIHLMPKQQHVALNCLFHAINWFYELLNCFTITVKQKKGQKVLMRLRLVVWLMDQLSYCLPLTMEYTPPICYYQCSLNKIPADKRTSGKGKRKKKTQKKRSGKKAKKSKQSKDTQKNDHQGDESDKEEEEDAVEEEEDEDDNDDEEGDDKGNDKNRKADLSIYSNYFRELDINVWLFLTQNLVFTPTPIQDGKVTDEMGPSELLFILDDFVKKIEHKLPSSIKKLTSLKLNSSNHSARFESIDTLEEEIIVKNIVSLLGNICIYFERTLEYTRNLIRESDEIYDSSSLFVPGSKEIKQCQNKIICIFSILFAWHGFKDNSNTKLFMDGLQKMAIKICLKKYKTPNKVAMITDICSSLAECAPKVLDIRTATSLVLVMKTLVEHIDESGTSIKPLISTTCLKFLSRPWFDLDGAKEQGSAYNKLLQILLQNY